MAKQYYQGETFDNVAPDFLHDAEFNDCTFINCRWSGARITACSFLGCTFDRCACIDPSDNQMKGARFSFPDVIALLNGFGLVIE